MDIKPLTLDGRLVRLEPLTEQHLPDLTLVAQDERIWEYLPYGSLAAEGKLRGFICDLLRRRELGTDLPFAVLLQASGRAIGLTRYLEIRPEHRSLEIGGTWYGVQYQGTGVNAECKYMLLKHAFEHLGCIRVQFKTDPRNERSQRALERLGAVREGQLRSHMIRADGTVRDSVFYSILVDEWPAIKVALEAGLGTGWPAGE